MKDTNSQPVKNAVIDTWQADHNGTYYFFSWTLRGKMVTDGKGRVELLTVRPGDYYGRAAHIHMRIEPTDPTHKPMTTQTYICTGNDPIHLSTDVCVIPVRTARRCYLTYSLS